MSARKMAHTGRSTRTCRSAHGDSKRRMGSWFAYARLKASSFEADLYRDFVVAHGQPGLEIGCGEGQPLLDLRSGGLEVEGVRLLSGHARAVPRERVATWR